MKLEQSFDVQAPIAQVWAALIDLERVAPCLPGAEITDAADDGTYQGTFKVKLGPTTAEYRGSIRMESLDEDAHVATMRAEGSDKRGQGGAKATIVSRLSEEDSGTRVDVDTDFTITGRLARFGRGGMIQDVSNRLLGEFARCLQQHLAGPARVEPASGNGRVAEESAPPAASEPLDAGSLVSGMVAERAKEAAPLIGLALLLGFLLGRASG